MAAKMVKVYTTPTCPWCRQTKTWLAAHNIAYQELNVAADKAALSEMIDLTHQMTVPTVFIDGEFIVGFDEKALKEKLGIN
jgi:glutaredoxin 3